MTERERMKELVDLLRKASRLYYQEATEMMSNLEYDALYDELLALEEKTGTVLAGSPTHQVGYEIVSSLPKKPHPQPMLSLNKTKSRQELAAFLGEQTGLLSWKLDGLTVVLTYEGGELTEGVTRGDGRTGEIITANVRCFDNVPLTIPHKQHLVLRGEAVISYADFEAINASLPEGEEAYKNPRNLCAGSVRQLSSAVTAGRHVQLYAFALVEAEGVSFTTRTEEMNFLSAQGFQTVFFRTVTGATVPGAVEQFAREVPENPIPSDGLVLLMDDIAYGKALGTTAKYPRNAMAFKWADELKSTRLISVQWSASRTGLINPVAVFEPVELEGTQVSRASVHNVSILEELALGYGDELLVYKANMIIPQIQENRTRSGSVRPPECCPVCGAPTRLREQNGVKSLYCQNASCPAKAIKSFALFVSRQGLNIEGLSEATLEKLIDLGCVRRFADLFRLESRREKIVALEGFGEKSFRNLLSAAEKARHTTLTRLVTALGIAGIGPATARELCGFFDDDPVRLRDASSEEILAVPGVGEVLAGGIAAYFNDAENLAQYEELLGLLELERREKGPRDLKGMTFVITGSLTHFPNRDALKELLQARGARVAGSVSANTSVLINNDVNSASAKNKTARQLGIPILSEEEAIAGYQLLQQ